MMEYMTPSTRKHNPILELGLQGIPAHEIATKTGLNYDNVRRQLSRYRERGFDIPKCVTVNLSSETNRAILEASRRRGIKVHTLLQRLVTVLVAENLIDAILDDGE